MLHRSPGAGTYARVEREQRWLLAQVPPDAADPTDITDRYCTGTTLRLRHIRAGDEAVYKLGQKVRHDPGSPDRVALTNIYLQRHEFELLDAALDGAVLHKTRRSWVVGGRVLAVDQFAGHLDGLVLAEIELDEREDPLPLPPFAVAGVTDDDRFSGGRLAHLSASEEEALLAEVAVLTGRRQAR